RFATGQPTSLMRAACRASTLAVSSVDGPFTTTTSKESWFNVSRRASSFARYAARSSVLTTIDAVTSAHGAPTLDRDRRCDARAHHGAQLLQERAPPPRVGLQVVPLRPFVPRFHEHDPALGIGVADLRDRRAYVASEELRGGVMEHDP